MAGLLVTVGASRVLALAGDLVSPSLSFPESIDAAWRESALRVVHEPAARFLGGHFVNASTTLRYGGDTAALNQFLAALAAIPGARLEIRFTRELPGHWTMEHDAWGDARRFRITLNVSAEAVRLEDLKLPEIVGEQPASGPEYLAPEKPPSAGTQPHPSINQPTR